VKAPPQEKIAASAATSDEPTTLVSSEPSEVAAKMVAEDAQIGSTLRGRPPVRAASVPPAPPPGQSGLTPLPTPPPVLTPAPVLIPQQIRHTPPPTEPSEMTPLPPPMPLEARSQVTPLPPPPVSVLPERFEPPSPAPVPSASRDDTTGAIIRTPAPIAEPARARKSASRTLIIVLAILVVAAGGYIAFVRFVQTREPAVTRGSGDGSGSGSSPPAVVKIDAAPVAKIVPPDAAPAPIAIDAAVIAQAPPVDAAPIAQVVPDAAAAPTPTDGKLTITSDPPGADVYLDGSKKGVTPIDLPATGDRHKLALVMAGRKLFRQEIDGAGKVEAKLEPADVLRGEGGIKVLKCKDPHRFYIIVDGKQTGQFCPNEDKRISVRQGDHVVEIYDPVTETTTPHKVSVQQTHSSVRLYISQ
jgi:hypothetical protein